MNDIEKRIMKTIDEADVSKSDIIARLTQLYHQLLLEERKRLIGVVEKFMEDHTHPVSDGYKISDEEKDKLIVALTTLNKEKD